MPPTTYARTIAAQLYVDWDFDTNYTDESARLIDAQGTLRLSPPESAIFSPRGTADRCIITLNNYDGRYSSLLTTGALYADVADGGAYHAPMYMQISVDGGANYYRVFTGVIKIPRENAPTAGQAATITLDCRSRDEQILSKRISTSLADFSAWVDSPPDEATLIGALLEDAGLIGADYTVDTGLFNLPYAWLDNESAIEACWEIAAACGGRFFCDPDGEFRYENFTHWLTSPHDASADTITRSLYSGFAPYYEDRELYSGVVVKTSQRVLGVSDSIWEARTVYLVPPNTVGVDYVNVTADLPGPAYSASAPTYAAVTSGGSDISADVTCTVTYSAQRILMQFQNANVTHAAVITGLEITGQIMEADEPATYELSSSNAFWTDRDGRTRSLVGNRWIQTQAQMQTLAEFLRDRHETPRLFFSVQDYRGSPARRLGDRITLNDSQIMSAARDAFIIGIDWRYGGGRFSQSLTCIDATTLYTYIDTTPTYFILDTDTLNGGARVFY